MVRIPSDYRMAIGLVAFAVFYFLCPIDLMPGVLLDDFAVSVIMGIGAYRKFRHGGLPGGGE